MATVCNLGRTDRALRIVLGVCMGIVAVLLDGHPYFARLLGIAGAVVILGATWGT